MYWKVSCWRMLWCLNLLHAIAMMTVLCWFLCVACMERWRVVHGRTGCAYVRITACLNLKVLLVGVWCSIIRLLFRARACVSQKHLSLWVDVRWMYGMVPWMKRTYVCTVVCLNLEMLLIGVCHNLILMRCANKMTTVFMCLSSLNVWHGIVSTLDEQLVRLYCSVCLCVCVFGFEGGIDFQWGMRP